MLCKGLRRNHARQLFQQEAGALARLQLRDALADFGLGLQHLQEYLIEIVAFQPAVQGFIAFQPGDEIAHGHLVVRVVAVDMDVFLVGRAAPSLEILILNILLQLIQQLPNGPFCLCHASRSFL